MKSLEGQRIEVGGLRRIYDGVPVYYFTLMIYRDGDYREEGRWVRLGGQYRSEKTRDVPKKLWDPIVRAYRRVGSGDYSAAYFAAAELKIESDEEMLSAYDIPD